MASDQFISVIEGDLRQLSQDARKAEGLAGFFSSSDHSPQVKEAAERAVLKLRSFSDQDNALEQIRNSKELLKPLSLACETKSTRLVCIALSILQKLLSNDAISAGNVDMVMAMLSNVERSGDDSVQLKTLQTALALLQSTIHPTSEEGLASILGLCFRMLSTKGHKDAVVSTASATVRQVVALVFSYVDASAESARLKYQAVEAAAGKSEHASSPTLIAAQRLLDDLVALASGAPAAWLKGSSLPRTLALEILDFVITHSFELFTQLPAFEHVLCNKVPQLLQAQLYDHLDAGAAGSTMAAQSFPAFKAVLRCIRTLLRGYHDTLGARCGSLIQAILKGTHDKYPNFQRVAVTQLLRQLLDDPRLVYVLFVAFDNEADRKVDAVHALVRAAIDIVDAMLKADNDGPLEAVATLYKKRSSGKDGAMSEADYENAPKELQGSYLTMLAIDSLLAVATSIEQLADIVSTQGGSGMLPVPTPLSPRIGSPRLSMQAAAVVVTASGTADIVVVRALEERLWRSMLVVLSSLLEGSNGEALVLRILRGYQSLTQSAGLLGLDEPRDALLKALCDAALSHTSASPSTVTPHPRSNSSEGGASPLHSRSASEELLPNVLAADIVVLNQKNVHCMRTLFNVARRLSGCLGASGWAVVLATVNTLDRVLDSPKTTTVDEHQGDLVILAAAASQLFQATANMDRAAVVALLSGLREVSISSIPISAQLSQTKLYALDRMVEVLLHNVSRIYDLWAVFLSHCLEVMANSKPQVRAAAIEALSKAIVGALSQLPRNPHGGSGDSSGGLEHMLLVALESLYNDDRERDVKLGVLRVLLVVVQRHGERLTDGWTPVFRLLSSVPAFGDFEATDLAFQCVSLIASDHMAAMPLARLRRCLEVAALYGSQQEDLNVSLTTISLLWNAADLFSRGSSKVVVVEEKIKAPEVLEKEEVLQEGGDDFIPSSNANGKMLQAQLTAAQTEDLLRLVFAALYALSRDERPEVRNSGVRTIFAAVVGQGPRLTKALWKETLWDMLFPLLSHAFLKSATSSKEEAEATLLGNSRGKEVRMVVHHSRNSEQKQWDETVVMALTGMARLLRAHLPTVAALGAKSIEAGWDELMVVAESGMAGGRKEVALAAIALLGAVMGTHGIDPGTVSDPMWSRAIRAIDVGVEASTTGNCMVPVSARLELLGLIGQIYCNPALIQSRFTAHDMSKAYRWVEAFCKNPWSDDDASNVVQTVGLPPVQKSALVLFPKLAPHHAPELWPDFLYSVVRLCKPEHIIQLWEEERKQGVSPVAAGKEASISEQSMKATPQKSAPSHRFQQKYALTSEFLQKVLEVLGKVYGIAPEPVKAGTLAPIVRALSTCMQVRYYVYEEQLWRAACLAFKLIVPIGLPALGLLKSISRDDIQDGWDAIAESFETFLLGKGVSKTVFTSENGIKRYESIVAQQEDAISTTDSWASQQDQLLRSDIELEASILDLLTNSVLTVCTSAETPAIARLVAVVDGGAVRPGYLSIPGSPSGSSFRQICLRKMYVLCARSSASDDTCQFNVARVTLPIFLARCEAVLRAYIDSVPPHQRGADAGPNCSPNDSKSRPRIDEVMCVLEILATMTLAPGVIDGALPEGEWVTEVVTSLRNRPDSQQRGRERSHLLLIYSALCGCISAREMRVRDMAKDVLQLAGAELGLGVPLLPPSIMHRFPM